MDPARRMSWSLVRESFLAPLPKSLVRKSWSLVRESILAYPWKPLVRESRLSGTRPFRVPDLAPICLLMVCALIAPPARGDDGGGATAAPAEAAGVPDGLSSSDWLSIRAAYEAGRHTAFAVEGGWQARNPGQQWRTRFDGRGFLTTPDAGQWSWGLELVSFGVEGAEQPVTAPACVTADGARVMYEWDPALTEWYINDQRGLEHGYTLHRRPGSSALRAVGKRGPYGPEAEASGNERAPSGRIGGVDQLTHGADAPFAWNVVVDQLTHGADAPFAWIGGVSRPEGARWLPEASASGSSAPHSSAARRADEPLQFTLAVRGDLIPRVDADGRGVTFVNDGGAAIVNYTGLTVFDADGVALPAWFAEAGEGLMLSVDDRGAHYPLTIDPIAQQAYLKASNTGAGDQFGGSVSVSGDTVVVGARHEASGATGVNGNQADNSAFDSGAAYVFVRYRGLWSQQAYLKASNTGAVDQFGYPVAVSGDTLVVGALGEDSSATGVNGNQADNSFSSAGAAYVFVRSGGVWSQQAYLKASNTGGGDAFGVSVAVIGDTVVVGAQGEDSSATGVDGNQADNSAFQSGAAYVFVRSGGVWCQQAYLKASNTGGGDLFGDPGDLFGNPVAVSGDTVVVGARPEASSATGVNGNQADNSAEWAGAAYVFVRSGGVWSQQAYLKASNTGAYDNFGSVAVSGDTVVVGALYEDSSATGVNGNQADNSSVDSGAAYVFVRSGGIWSQQAYLKASNTGAADVFGLSVAVSGDIVVVGALGEDSNATGVNGNQVNNSASNSGAAYIFTGVGPAQLPGNCDGDDGDVDLTDFAAFPGCLTGPAVGPIDPSCGCYDINVDQAVDVLDFAELQNAFTG